jgi:hypothetical protein
VEGGRVLHEDGLGRLEIGVLLDTHLGRGRASLAEGWGGDRYVLVEGDGDSGLAWVSVWDDEDSRDGFVAALADRLSGFGGDATLQAIPVAGRAGAMLRVGLAPDVIVTASAVP